jgi:hypothetical protein
MLVLDVREPSPAGTSTAARRSEKKLFPNFRDHYEFRKLAAIAVCH